MKNYNILFLVAIVVSLFACGSKERINQDEFNSKTAIKELKKEEVLQYMTKGDNVQFVDIRDPKSFADGHLDNAINIPQKNFFNDEALKSIPKDKKIIIYGEGASDARLTALMAARYKKGKYSVALGGYEYIKGAIAKSLDSLTYYSDEKPIYDYKKKYEKLLKSNGASGVVVKTKKAAPKAPIKRKKKEISGGCG